MFLTFLIMMVTKKQVFLTGMFVEGYFKPKHDLILTQPSGICA